jgi:glycosyltransferase involved in cell wall biosynthesis
MRDGVKILTYSRAFLPHVGGLEYNVHNLVSAMARAGHEVIVVTTTSGNGPEANLYRVIRRPSPVEFLALVRWCDVFHQANVSLRGWWPLLFVRRPWVVSHHSWYRRPGGRIAWQDRLKRRLLRHASGSIAVSRAVAADLPLPATVIENAYRHDLFRILPGVPRNRALLFVGRLVSDKGVDVLLEAVARLARGGFAPNLTVAGEGPDRRKLERRAGSLGIGRQVTFCGTVTGDALVELMNRHQILVVPSRYHEPFGIVALEGIACGCVIVGSSGGGLADAIGPCGETFPNGDATALATVLERLLSNEAARACHRAGSEEHLRRHQPDMIAARYLEVLEAALSGRAC